MTLLRIGYGGYKSPDLFVAAVQALQPDLVIDARFSTWSRPGFRGYELKRAFAALSIPYQHRRSLGNENYKGPGPIVIAEPSAIAVVHEEALIRRVVLFCVCRTDAPGCHLAVILRGDVGVVTAPRLL